jgi:putative RNA 2'-phosphotransferase
MEVEEDGYISIHLLIKMYNFTESEILEYVSTDKKMRFQINENKDKIRATQGHSLKHIIPSKCFNEVVDEKEINELKSKKIVHYTFKKNIESILQEGLKPMNRTSIHFLVVSYTDTDTNIKNVRKIGTDVEIVLDIEKWLKDGNKIYKSVNGYVMILESVDKMYLKLNFIN